MNGAGELVPDMAAEGETVRQGAMTWDRHRLGDACEIGLGIAAFLFLPALALVSHALAPLVGVAGLLALGRAWPLDRAGLRRLLVPAGLCLALVLWGAGSSAWAIEPARSLLIAVRLAGLFAAALALAWAARRLAAPGRLVACFAGGAALALLLAEAQFATDGALTRPFFEHRFVAPNLNQLCDALDILVVPLAAMLLARGRAVLSAVVLVLAAAAVYHFVGSAAKFGFAVAIAAALLFRLGGRNLARAAAVLSVLVVLAAPATLPRLAHVAGFSQDAAEFKFSLWHRLQIWSFVGDRIAEKPFFGWGLDSSRAIPGGTEQIRPGAQRLPLHPHDAALQVWLELGLPGALLFAGLVAWLWLALGRADWPPLYRAATAAGLATAEFAALGTYGVWQEWWIATLSVGLFLVLSMARLVDVAVAAGAALSPSSAPRAVRSRT